MKNRIPLRQLIFLAICIALSLVTKRVISPITNILTDFIRIPGGGAATAFSLMFLLLGSCAVQWPCAGTLAGFTQSLIALGLGMSAYQGAFALLTYTLPGIVIDLFRRFCPRRDTAFFLLSCAAANTAGACLTNLLVFQLKGIACVLWLLVACTVGLLGGFLGALIFRKVGKLIPFQENAV